jgi:hypothetical protein
MPVTAVLGQLAAVELQRLARLQSDSARFRHRPDAAAGVRRVRTKVDPVRRSR